MTRTCLRRCRCARRDHASRSPLRVLRARRAPNWIKPPATVKRHLSVAVHRGSCRQGCQRPQGRRSATGITVCPPGRRGLCRHHDARQFTLASAVPHRADPKAHCPDTRRPAPRTTSSAALSPTGRAPPHAPQGGLGWTRASGRYRSWFTPTLAPLTIPEANRRANDHRHRATSGHVQPFSLQPGARQAAPGDVRRRYGIAS